MSDDGHRYTFGSPKDGWPSFGPDGKRLPAPGPVSEPDAGACTCNPYESPWGCPVHDKPWPTLLPHRSTEGAPELTDDGHPF